jgi:GDP-L-fucose synthase
MKAGQQSITLWGTGKVSREFLYAPDCAEAIGMAIEKDVSPSPINIGTGKEIKICELAKEIAEQMGFDGKILYDPKKPDGQPRRCLDTDKAKDLLGFEAKTGFNQGIKETIEWFLKTRSNS